MRLRRSWRGALRLVQRTIPLPWNEPTVSAVIDSAESAPGATTVAVDFPATSWRPQAARSLDAVQHPALAPCPPDEQVRARVVVLASAAVDVRTGVVYAQDRRPIRETAHRRQTFERVVRSRRTPRRRALAGTYAPLLSEWSDNYYHWLVNDLPRYLVLEQAGLADTPLLVPEPLKAYQRDSLGLLGVPPERLVPSRGQVVGADALVWVQQPVFEGAPVSWVCDTLRGRLQAALGPTPDSGLRRLLISRRHARHRRVLNEAEVAAALATYGFEVVVPERLPFREQLDVFRAAEVVVAPHGAGLANLLFATNATVVEILHPDWVNPCYQRLVDRAGHRYWYLLGGRVDRQGGPPPYRDICVPVAKLIRTVERMLDANPN